MEIAFLYTDGRIRRKARLATGEAAEDFFHGSEVLARKGYEVALFELTAVPSPGRLMLLLGEWLRRCRLLPHKVDGDTLGRTWQLLSDINRHDLVVVSGSPLAYALAIWRRLGLCKAAIVAIQCGMMNYPFFPVEQFLTRRLQRQMWSVLYGEGEYGPFCEFLGPELKNRVFINAHGADVGFWTPAADDSDDGYVFAIGNDGRRDYDLLMRVAANVDMPFKVVTSAVINEYIPPNVELIKGDLRQEILTDVEVRDLFRKARLVVVPLKDSMQPSGQSVCLQAMACAKPVILTKTKGLWSKTKLQHEKNVLLVAPGDESTLTTALIRLYGDAKLRHQIAMSGLNIVHQEWTSEQYADRMIDICKHTEKIDNKPMQSAWVNVLQRIKNMIVLKR